MLFAEIDGTGWSLIIAAILSGIGKIILDYRQNAAAAQKVEQVAKTLQASNTATEEKLNGMAEVGKATHTLVNNAMQVQLKLNAVLSRRMAIMTNDPADIAAAELAEKLHAEHVAKQDIVDAGK